MSDTTRNPLAGFFRTRTPQGGVPVEPAATSEPEQPSASGPSATPAAEGAPKGDEFEGRISALEEGQNKIIGMLEKMKPNASEDEETEPAAALPDEPKASAPNPVATLAQLKAAMPDSSSDFREACVLAGYTVDQAKAAAVMVGSAAGVANAAAMLGTNQPTAAAVNHAAGGDQSPEAQLEALVSERASALSAVDASLTPDAARQKATAEVVMANPALYAQVGKQRHAERFAKANNLKPEALAY